MPLQNAAVVNAAASALDKYLESASTALSTVARKEAAIRDAFDDLAKTNIEYARGPHMNNPTMKTALELYAKHLVAAEDFRDAKIEHMEGTLLSLLSTIAHDNKQIKHLRKRNSSGSEQKLSGSQTNLSGSHRQSGSLDALAQFHKEESEMVNMERKNLQQLKKFLTDTVMLEISFHSHAIEQLSPILTAINNVNVESDLQEYCKVILGISSGGPAGLRKESAASSGARSPQNTAKANSPPPVKVTTVKQRDAPNVKDSSSFDDDDDYETYEDDEEEFDTTEASGPPLQSNWSVQKPASSRPMTGAKGPPVPERRDSGQKTFDPNLFLGSGGK